MHRVSVFLKCSLDNFKYLLASSCSPDVLHQLVVAREGLETLLTLMRLHLGSASDALSAELHRRLGHQILKQKLLKMGKYKLYKQNI